MSHRSSRFITYRGFIISYFISKKKCNLAPNIYRFSISYISIDHPPHDYSSVFVYHQNFKLEIKYPWLEEQQAKKELSFFTRNQFSYYKQPSPCPVSFQFSLPLFFYHPAPPSSVFLILVLGPTGFLLVSQPLFISPHFQPR